jgi:hypothetical protein
MSGELAMHLLTKSSGLSWSIARFLSARKSDMTSLARLLQMTRRMSLRCLHNCLSAFKFNEGPSR